METKEFEFKGMVFNGFLMLFVNLLLTIVSMTGIVFSFLLLGGNNGGGWSLAFFILMLIAVVIMKFLDAETLFIDTWLMSCRVLRRGVEHFVLNTLVNRAREAGCRRIIGEYLPTPKNKMVEQHYPDLGFTPLPGSTTPQYCLEVDSYQEKECFIKLKG